MLIKDARFIKGSVKLEQLPPADRPEVAFVGRSNVGKSSLINALTQRKNLARTSATPGKTREINHFLINEHWYLADLPGYGYAKVGKKERAKFLQMILDYVVERPSLMNTFVLIDSRIPPQDIDLEFCEFLQTELVPYAILLTKTDKPKQKDLHHNVESLKKALNKRGLPVPPLVYTSSVKNRGIKELGNYIDELLASYA